ncbi:MAG: GH92 family glycosyl hydrolase [Bacteroidota bacterium]
MQNKLFLVTTLLVFTHFYSKAESNNIAPQATVTASSTYNKSYEAANVTDGIIGIENKGEWACYGESASWGYVKFPWIKLDWKETQVINRIVLYDRPAAAEYIASGKLLFSDGSVLWVDQIPNNGTAKSVTFSPRKIKWVKFIATDGDGKNLGFSEIEVFSAPEQYKDHVAWVDPYIETNRGRYFFFITGCRPFGMISAAPHTRNKNQWGGGYVHNEDHILGYGQIHDWSLSGLEIMPVPGTVNPTLGETAWKSIYSHDDEIVQPGYQRNYLRDHHTWVEQTSTDRVSFYRFTYTQSMKAQVITNLGGYLGGTTMTNAQVTRTGQASFEGSFSDIGRLWGGPKDVKVFFVVTFDKAFETLDGWQGKKRFTNVNTITGDSAGVAPQYDVKAGDQLQMKIAISYTSIANARNNLKQECPGWDFDQIKSESRAVWEDWLCKMDVKGGSIAQRKKFYTNLWHVLLGRHMNNDISGDYADRTTPLTAETSNGLFKIRTLPKGEDGKPKFNMYNSDAFWLTQWNLNVLWGLAWPKVQDDMSASLIQFADDGGLLPRGPVGGGDTFIMTSCPATNLIVSTYQKGLLKATEPEHAFEVMRRNHLPGGILGSKEDIQFYTENGYWPNNAGITIEAAFQDYALSQMALKLNHQADYNFFLKRSTGWKKLYEPNQKLLFPKNKTGQFIHTDPLAANGWVEANAWQATWGVSHDIDGLAKLMGGKNILCDKLNYAFEKAEASDFVYDYGKGYISYANQPGCSDAHVFNYAGKPWLTQYWVRKVLEQAYGGITPDLGYGGSDEDQGQMGGLGSLMAIGLFNLQGNVTEDPVYDITSPVFDKVTIKLDKRYYSGNQFVITTFNNSAKNMYIQKAALNGKPLNHFQFKHTTYAKGGKLAIWLGPKPNKLWGKNRFY